MKRRIFVVDDHPIMRKGYVFLIEQEANLEVCGEAGSALEALDEMPRARPDLVIVDISLGGMSGLELIKHLRNRYPDLPTLVVSTHDEALYGERALMAGARGYLMKSEVDTAVVKAIRSILQGGLYLSNQMSLKILLQYQRRKKLPAAEEAGPVQRLSDRELEVFELTGRAHAIKLKASRF